MTSINIILANLIYMFHVFIILFVIITPFTKIPAYLILHIVFSISLIVHWYNNNNVCSLSMFESKLRGIPYTNSFSHQFIGPVYDISSTGWSKICYILTIILASISLYYLITSPSWSKFKKCIDKTKKYINENKNLNFSKKFDLYIECLSPLFFLENQV